MIGAIRLTEKPYLPNPGDVYWVDTEVFYDIDPKRHRPVLVASVSRSTVDHITVVARTTDLSVDTGVFSAVDLTCGLNKPGVWSRIRHAKPHRWARPLVEWRGVVDMTELMAVRAEFNL